MGGIRTKSVSLHTSSPKASASICSILSLTSLPFFELVKICCISTRCNFLSNLVLEIEEFYESACLDLDDSVFLVMTLDSVKSKYPLRSFEVSPLSSPKNLGLLSTKRMLVIKSLASAKDALNTAVPDSRSKITI